MNTDYQSNNFKKLLDKLQTESWQLELLISGFAIFGLFQTISPIQRELLKAVGNDQQIYAYFIKTVHPTLIILLTVLLVHVVLRGVWIGALGLRYVSGDIDYKSLNYSEKFTKHLTKKVGSFDRYISQLENICSTLFAIAFLMIFYFLAYMLILGFFVLITSFVELTGLLNKEQLEQFTVAWALLYFCLVILVFIDFIGMGVLKKGKLRTKIYFPIYRFFSLITLSFLYRPLVYNFLDQKKVRWLSTFILPAYLVGSFIVSSFSKQPSNYLFKNSSSSAIFSSNSNYEDLLTHGEELVDFATIPSKVITTPYLLVKIPFTTYKEDAVFEQDSTLLPDKDERGYGINTKKINIPGISIRLDENINIAEQKKYLNAINKMYTVLIDSTVFEKEFIYTLNADERFQFETFLDISELRKGKHLLYIVGPRKTRVSFKEKKIIDTLVSIPFWYFPTKTKALPSIKTTDFTEE